MIDLLAISKNNSSSTEYFSWKQNPVRYTSNRITNFVYGASGELLYEEITETVYENSIADTLTKRKEYIYDANGVCGCIYTRDNGVATEYYYGKNVYGDILEVYDANGNIVCEYTYDAFGCSYVTDHLNDGFATENPFRYRGYYYDETLDLYYLSTRFYDPETGRFISPDTVDYIDPELVNGLNLYVYCNNDPINFVDPSGHSWQSFLSGVSDWFSDNWVKIAIGAGAIALGALTMGTATLISGAGISAALSAMGTSAVSSLVQVGISSAISASIGLTVGGITSGSWEGALDGMLNGIADGFMWGGIFAGAGQTISGAMKITRSLAPEFNGLKIGKLKLWSPNSATNYNAGGTLLKFGRFNRIDAEIGNMLHIHFKLFGHVFNHFPIGMIAAGIIGGF